MEIFLTILLFTLLVLGLIFIFVPGLPGPLVAWAGMPIYLLCTSADVGKISWLATAIFGVLAAGTFLADFLASSLGAKKFGGTKWGAIGAFLGAIFGPILFAPIGLILGAILGVIIGPAIGAFLGEILFGANLNKSTGVATGAFLAALITFVLKFTFCLALFIYLVVACWF